MFMVQSEFTELFVSAINPDPLQRRFARFCY